MTVCEQAFCPLLRNRGIGNFLSHPKEQFHGLSPRSLCAASQLWGFLVRDQQLLRSWDRVSQWAVAGVKRPFSIAGISVSSLSDNLFVLHVHCEDNKQKVAGLLLWFSSHLYKINFEGTKNRRSSWGRGWGTRHGDIYVTNFVPALRSISLKCTCAHGWGSPVPCSPRVPGLSLIPITDPLCWPMEIVLSLLITT